MSIENMVQTIKQIHKQDVVLIKVGTFYHAYGRDSYILSYLFGYKRKVIGENIGDTGFPKTALNKVKYTLEKNKINYLTIDRSHNYEVEDKVEFKGENKYQEMYEKAHKYIGTSNRIHNITQYLMENIEQEVTKQKIERIEEILYEAG